MEKLKLETIEEMLKGRISKNTKRFEEANGIVFTTNNNTDELYEYFSDRGVEIYELENELYYTETVMSVGEFSNLNHVEEYRKVA